MFVVKIKESIVENSGKRIPQEMCDYFLAMAREDPKMTNAELSQKTSKIFARKIDQTTIGVYRRRAGIPSSKEAIAAAASNIVLSVSELKYLRGLVEKIMVPQPDAVRMTDTVREVGLGHIGTIRRRIWINHLKGNLTQVWFPDTEEEWLLEALPVDSLRNSFVDLMGQGRATIQKILDHNSAIDNGLGEIPISEVLELSRMRDPAKFISLDRRPYEIWQEHVALVKAIELFKLDVEAHFSPPRVLRAPPEKQES